MRVEEVNMLYFPGKNVVTFISHLNRVDLQTIEQQGGHSSCEAHLPYGPSR